ncbi:glycerophosphodiester phosphodiesterase [Sinorhizobium numidicum]|uniref:Glycerophosphodiester phosphodiesterase n=1 Tax=Sinorhizobium numidicum TaxID=680248 RepID=A0ABY8CZL7_9HYPH|nr:glycerophosphodiester phosphodiesterase [Sinorhizobium numidicum]WEX78816.1 glycerophosphodiester phosphodiesterase [Sinorhizobium numidicum]WEX82213.1 glycerophosphodiester phosphodiesterase [Sinorhizobium numidicum]
MTDISWLKAQPIAHRGYHDMNREVWENTLSAFSRAADAGFAIECDLQYTADSVPVVFHDHDMERLCGIKGDVRAKTAGELGLLSIGGTKDKVPTLSQMLRVVNSRVPIIIELKGRRDDDEGFAAAVLDTLEGYQGHVALMSFDHWLLKDLKALDAPYPLGLTAEGANPETFFVHEEAMQLGLDFISYFYGHLPNAFISKERALGHTLITWTVRDRQAQEHSFAHADQMTFEGFDPRETMIS